MQDGCRVASLLRKVFRYPRTVIAVQFLALVATLLTVAVPLFVPLLVDELLLGKSHGFSEYIRTYIYPFSTEGLVFFVLGITLTLRLASVLAEVWQSKLFTAVSKRVTYALRETLLDHMRQVSLKAYETMQSGAISSRLVTDVETLDAFISVTISKLIVSVLVLLFSSAVLLWIDWKLGLFIIFTNPIVIFYTAKLARRTGALKREENKAVEAFHSELVETIELVHQIRAANKDDYFFEKVRRKAETLRHKAVAYGYRSSAAQKFSYLVFLSGYELFRAVSILAVSYGELSVGLMLAIFSYLWVMVSPTQELIGFYYALHNAKAACGRIASLLDLPKEPRYNAQCNPFGKKEPVGVALNKVSFSYDGITPVLDNVSITIAPGAKVALVGPSGSGKTTLAQLLVGFYTPDQGEIRYGTCNYKSIGLSRIRARVHLILQHPKLFNATMRFNLTLGRDYDEAHIREALRVACLEEVVAKMEKGLDTPVGKDGVKLSGGQRQRVAIARMVLADPDIVILDESTSALDVRTEAQLFSELERFWKEKTVITVAHRLSTIERAGYVYVLEAGKVTQYGTPDALQKRAKGYFATMV